MSREITNRLLDLVETTGPAWLGRLLADVRRVERVEALTDTEVAEAVETYLATLDHRDPAVDLLGSVADRLRRASGGPCSTVTPSGAALPACRECDGFAPCEHDRGRSG